MPKRILKFFDKAEDDIRSFLSKNVILYAVVGGVCIVLFWRGVWYTADMFPFLNGPNSVIISSVVLLFSGLFVSFFVGDRIVLSGLKREKKLVEKTEEEMKTDIEITKRVLEKLEKMEKDLEEIKKNIKI